MKQSSLFGIDTPKSPKFFEKLRKQAKRVKKAKGIRQHEALDAVAQKYGFANWDAVVTAEKDTLSISVNVAPPRMIEEFKDDPEPERSGDLTDEQKRILSYNREFLARYGIDYAVFEPTRTGIKKSIFDATQPVRLLFEKEGFHTYRQQGRTQSDKVIKPAFFVRSDREPEETDARLYRPKTKKGDPRMWFPRIKYFADPGDQVAIIFYRGSPYLVILTKTRFPDLHGPLDSVASFLRRCTEDRDAIARELLGKLKALAGKPIVTQKTGPTAVGTELELKLGLQTNSNKMPDYKGIELKTGRLGKTGRSMNRTTLFAQVADWNLSECKSSREILETYGYLRDGLLRLNCTVRADLENTQGLKFVYAEREDALEEVHSEGGRVAVWPGNLLRGRLKEKHAETFWIDVEATVDPDTGVEAFTLHSVIHTKSPLENQLMPLIAGGVITMDHLIKKKDGRVSERGPLFKIDKKNLRLLFPEPIKYDLKTDGSDDE